jgi:putative tryptophan/tyrosine transport system substrate-binding protein
MRRRQFATLGIAGAALAGNRSPAQQPSKLPRIGWLWLGRSTGNPHEVTGFRQGLKDFGYVEGQSVVVDYRFAEGRSDRIAALAIELMQLRPDVLVAVGTTVTTTIKATTSRIPVVFLSGDAVREGFVASLAHPGGHITGVSLRQGAEGLAAKRIELLKDALPNAVRIGIIFNPDFPVAVASVAQAQEVATRRGLILLQAPVRQFDEIDTAVGRLVRENVQALNVEPVFPVASFQPEIGELLLRYRIPAVSELRLLIQSGGLISYGPNIFDAARRMAYFVDRILKGANPADLPVEQASKFELVINMKTARLLDIEVPPILLARADELIE